MQRLCRRQLGDRGKKRISNGRWHRCRMGFPLPAPFPTKRTEETIHMRAVGVTDQGAGTAGMTLVERPEPQAAINDVVVQVHASGFTWDELTWPSTWTDRLGRDRTPVINRPRLWHDGAVGGT